MKPDADIRMLTVLAAGLVVAVLAACSPRSPEVSYYSLFAARVASPVAGKDTGTVLVVGPVTAPDILRRSQIATGSGSSSYRLSDFHRWAGDIEKDFARALAELLGSRPGAGKVVLYPGTAEATCQVAADILVMEGELGQEARLSVSWSLLSSAGQSAAISRRSDLVRTPEDAGHQAWVRAQQANIAQLSEEIGTALQEGGCLRQ